MSFRQIQNYFLNTCTHNQASEAIKYGAELVHSTPPANGIYEISPVCGNKPYVFPTLQLVIAMEDGLPY